MPQSHLKTASMPDRVFKYYDIIAMLAIAVILISNTVAQKVVPVMGLNLNAAIILFPLAYLISDILTEVYGYARARRVTWMMFACLILMVVCYQASVLMPHADFWANQDAFAAVLGAVPRIVIASMTAILIGDFVNCFVMSKMKIATKGKHLWLRTTASTFFGQGVDSLIFYTMAFYGVMPNSSLLNAVVTGWLVKTAYEFLLTPLTYLVVNKLKRAEGIDHFDHGISYTPFSLKVDP